MTDTDHDPKQEAREFIAAHLHPGDLLPHLAMKFEIAAAALEKVLAQDLAPEERDKIRHAREQLYTGFHVCVELPHHGELVAHVGR